MVSQSTPSMIFRTFLPFSNAELNRVKDFIGKPKKGIEDSINDVSEIKRTLEDINIQVKVEENLKHDEFIKTVEDFSTKIKIKIHNICIFYCTLFRMGMLKK